MGGYPLEYQIDVDPNKLRAYDVTLGQLFSAVARANSSVGGRVIQKANAEFLVRSVGWVRSLKDLENIVIKTVTGTPVYVSNVASVQFGSAYRRSSLEKDGHEAVGGVVLMRYGENPLKVTRKIKEKIQQLQAGLPPGVRIVPFYERTELINRAIDTVTHTLVEEMIVASLAVILILWHLRSSLLICLTLPLSVLFSFILMRYFNVSSNIMSLSGIAISIGVLVDSSIVMVENATHHLYKHFGSQKVSGDTRNLALPALTTVGRPIFFSVAIMIISFIPVFALGGMEGRMFHPLAFTKTFAMVGVAILSITLVPALVPIFVRGRLRSEEESWIVRSVIEIYKPVLNFLLSHPWPIFLFTSVIFIVGLTPIGSRPLSLSVLFIAALATLLSVHRENEDDFTRRRKIMAFFWAIFLAYVAKAGWERIAEWLIAPHSVWHILVQSWWGQTAAWILLAVALFPIARFICRFLGGLYLLGRTSFLAALIIVALVADQNMTRLGREFVPPLDEGSILDMPVTVPRASITQATDDLLARDRLLRMFPEVELVVGKAGRAERQPIPHRRT